MRRGVRGGLGGWLLDDGGLRCWEVEDKADDHGHEPDAGEDEADRAERVGQLLRIDADVTGRGLDTRT